MKLSTNILGFLLLLFFIEHINSNQYISVILQRCSSDCNKKYCNMSYVCRPLNRTSKKVSLDLYIKPGMKLEAPIEIEIIGYKKFRTVYRQHMLKFKAEVCSHLINSDHPFFSRFWNLDANTNIQDPCPLSGHRYIKPYIPTFDHFPLVPVGEWKVEYTFSKNNNNSNEFIMSWAQFYEVKPTSALEF